ncbi:MAG: hypothetical protein JWR83_785, partial [Aeromicrobium sp.]|nr:hypothetical protein [Aeromicrobium sp.]
MTSLGVVGRLTLVLLTMAVVVSAMA